MATSIGALQVDLLLQSVEFARSINRASEQVNALGRAVNQHTAAMTRGFETVATSVKAFAAGFIGIGAVQQLTRATTATFAWANALKDASDRIGIGVEQMQRLQRAAALTNVSNEQVTKNLEIFARGLGNAAKGTGTLHTALKSTGISLREQDGALRSVNEVFDEYAAAIAGAGTEQEALALAVAAFGRGGAGFVTTIKQMSEGMEEWTTLTKEQVAQLGKYDNVIAEFGEEFTLEFRRRLAGSIAEGERLIAIFDRLFGTNIANAALVKSVDELNTKLEESTNLLQRYQDAAAQSAKGGAILQPSTLDRITDLERERIGILNQLKRASEDVSDATGELGSAADSAADEFKKLNAALSLIDVSMINTEEMARRMGQLSAGGLSAPDFSEEAKRQQQATKQAAAEVERLSKARIEGIAALKLETSQLERLAAAHKESAAEVRRVELAIEVENAAKRLNVELGSETAAVIAEEVKRRRELTEAVDMLAAAEEQRMDVLRAMNEEEMGRRMGQAEAGGMSAPGVQEEAETAASETQRIFENAADNIQSAFANAFTDAFEGNITSAQDFADTLKSIFTKTAGEIAAAMVIKPVLATLPMPGGESGAGGQAGAGGREWFGGQGSGAFFTSPTRPTMGQAAGGAAFGGMTGFATGGAMYPGHTGAMVGGTVGGAIGGAAGSVFGPGGAMLGSMAGGALGSFIGRQFGAGEGQDNKVVFQGQLGIGVGGTGAAAQLVMSIDKSIQSVLTAAQEGVANRMLKVAQAVGVQYDKEMSANDMAALAAGRIKPVAGALGLQGSQVAKGTPEEQFANLQQALAIMQQVKAIDLGPLGSELEILKTTFNETAAAAKKFGVDNRDELEKQYRFERAAIQRRFASERVGLEELFGQRSSESAAIAQMTLQFREAEARAQQLGLSTVGMGEAMAAAAEDIRAQAQAQRAGIIDQARSLAGLPQTFKSTIDALRAQFDELRATMVELGGSVAELNALEAQAMAAANAQRVDRLKGINVEAQGLMGTPQTTASAFDALMDSFTRLRNEARALGGNLDVLTQIQKEATAAFVAQVEVQQQDIINRARGFAGLPQTFQSDFDALMQHFMDLRKEMRATGGNLSELTALQKQATAALIARRNAELEAINVQAKQIIGEPLTVDERFDALMDQFLELRKQTRALGGSLTELTAIQKRATAAFLAQIEAEKRAVIAQAQQLTGRPLTFGQEWDALMAQFTELRKQARALGMDLGALTEIQKEAQAQLIKQQQATRDTMLLSIVEPFKQLLEPLQAFAKELTTGNMNPLGQMEASRTEFERIAALARAGDVNAIQQLQAAGQAYIQQMERFGASPAGATAREDVLAVVNDIMANLSEAQKQASSGVEGAIAAAADRQVDTLNELIAVGRQTVAEIMRLSKAVTPAKMPTSKPMDLPRAEIGGGPLRTAVKKSDFGSGGLLTGEVMSSLINKLDQSQKEERGEFLDAIKRAAQREIDKMGELAAEIRSVGDEIKRQGRK